MTSVTDEQERIRRYLLGTLPQEEGALLEQRLLSDGEFFEEVLIVEDELVDEYLTGNLPLNERENFVSHFLVAPERQQKLRFSKAWLRYLELKEGANSFETSGKKQRANQETPIDVGTPSSKSFSFWSPIRSPRVAVSLMAALFVALLGSWLVFRQSAFEKISHTQNQNFVAFTLLAGSTRSDGSKTQRLSIPAGKRSVRLELELSSNGYQRYNAELLTIDNIGVQTGKGLKAEVVNGKNVVLMDVPADSLRPGDYQVRLSGVSDSNSVEPVATYRFRELPH